MKIVKHSFMFFLLAEHTLVCHMHRYNSVFLNLLTDDWSLQEYDMTDL